MSRIRQRWPQVEIVVRADSSFARDKILSWCEEHGVDYVIGLQKNKRLLRAIARDMRDVEAIYEETAEPWRRYRELVYRTRKTWSRSRRVVAKVECLEKGANPRFVVTSLSRDQFDACTLYLTVRGIK